MYSRPSLSLRSKTSWSSGAFPVGLEASVLGGGSSEDEAVSTFDVKHYLLHCRAARDKISLLTRTDGTSYRPAGVWHKPVTQSALEVQRLVYHSYRSATACTPKGLSRLEFGFEFLISFNARIHARAQAKGRNSRTQRSSTQLMQIPRSHLA